jgi:hypothetical protein
MVMADQKWFNNSTSARPKRARDTWSDRPENVQWKEAFDRRDTAYQVAKYTSPIYGPMERG